MLDADVHLGAQTALSKFCPMSYFPSQAETKEAVVGFMHVKDSGRCGGTGVVLSKTVADAAACVALAANAGVKVFILAAFFYRGWCPAGIMIPSDEEFAGWQKERINPVCCTSPVCS